MNIFDGVLVTISIVEAAFLDSSSTKAITAFRSARIFRTFRVLRVTRLLRSLAFMKIIIGAIGRSLKSFASIAILIFIMLFIYTLLGMNVLGGNLNKYLNRTLYDSFWDAFLSSFQVMITENWNNVLQSVYASHFSTWIGSIYLVSWVIIGNWILLNLFLAIILDEFSNEDAQKDQMELEEELRDAGEDEDSLYSQYMAMSGAGSTTGGSSNFNKSSLMSQQNQNSKLRLSSYASALGRIGEEDTGLESAIDDIEDSDLKQKQEKKEPRWVGVECEDAFFFLTKDNKIRSFCYDLIRHNGFETVILGGIVFSSLKLAIQTYFSNSDEKANEVFLGIDYFFTVFFAIEMVLKLIAFGVIIDSGSYFRDYWNMLDGFVVITSIIDSSVPSVNISFIRVSVASQLISTHIG